MTWVRMDDQFWRNEKQLQMSDAAYRVWTCSWSYCAQSTDPTGFLSKQEAKSFIRFLGKSSRVIPELLARHAWEAVEDGYLIHDLDHYLDPGSRDRVRRWREKRKQDGSTNVTLRGGYSPVTRNAENRLPHARAHPVPVPVPVTKSPPMESSSSLVPIEPERGDVLQLCQRMVELNEQRDAKARTITRGWRRQAKLLLDQDGRSLNEALSLLEWAAFDSFWGSNILSIPNFREHYDRLRMQRERAPVTASNGRVANHRAYDDRLANLEHRLREEGA